VNPPRKIITSDLDVWIPAPDVEQTVDVKQALNCAKCAQELNPERRHEVRLAVKFFGIGGGWRLCDCNQMLLKGWGPKKLIKDLLTSEDWHGSKGPTPGE
jgi:hypothetical protein